MNKTMKKTVPDCPCGSKKRATECCLLLIKDHEHAVDAEQLMRSRYTAYTLGEDGYILDTWHSSTRPGALDQDNSVSWTGLKVLKASREINNTAYVEFVASFEDAGKEGKMHERSRFLLENGCWYYVDGEQLETQTHIIPKKPGRNEPCHCGSGRKFKKCCGNKPIS